MTELAELLDRNRAFAANRAAPEGIPRQPLFLLTCIDPRTDPAVFLGLEHGDAPVLRNAGGRVTEAVIADVAFIGDLATAMGSSEGPLFEVVVIHHTQCGTGFLADAGFRQRFAARTGYDEEALASWAVVDPAATVRADVARLLGAPRISPRISVSGHVYDIATGLMSEVVPPSWPEGPPTVATVEAPAGAA